KLRPTARRWEQDRLERSCTLCGAHCPLCLAGTFRGGLCVPPHFTRLSVLVMVNAITLVREEGRGYIGKARRHRTYRISPYDCNRLNQLLTLGMARREGRTPAWPRWSRCC